MSSNNLERFLLKKSNRTIVQGCQSINFKASQIYLKCLQCGSQVHFSAFEMRQSMEWCVGCRRKIPGGAGGRAPT